jgi:hypothetical protein
MACTGAACTCGCCLGIGLSTPVPLVQPPGRAAIAHRAGRRSDHLASMLAALSGDLRAAGLATRDAGDVSIALCDAAASLLDVIGFQTERVADEHYLGSAKEARSVAWLAELVGYQPRPGVAASVDLAFTLTETPGLPVGALPPVTVPAGTRAQSVPGPGEVPQSFETGAAIEARPAWNAIAMRMAEPWQPRPRDRHLWLAGLATGLSVGDAILIVGAERLADKGSEHWDLRVLTELVPEPAFDRTRIGWARGLGSQWPAVLPAGDQVSVYAFRKRIGLFGAAAPDARLLEREGAALPITNGRWNNYRMDSGAANPRRFDLDQEVPGVVEDGWVALRGSDALGGEGYTELYGVKETSTVARADFGLSAKVTRVVPDTDENLSDARFPLNGTTVWCASEALAAVGRPISLPVYGAALELAIPLEGLAPGRRLAVTGKAVRVRIVAPGISLAREGALPLPIPPGSEALVTGAPERPLGGGYELIPPAELADAPLVRLALRLEDGTEGRALFGSGTLTIVAPRLEDPELSAAVEIARVADEIELADPLLMTLDRASVRVNANVAPATAGETVAETLGGSTGRPDQRFALKQSPLTWVPAGTPEGRASTLALRVNGMLWQEAPTLAGAAPGARVYATRTDDRGATHLLFGDGVEGAVPPGGAENLRAIYRRTLGGAGNVAAGAITTLATRPAGVSEVRNPEAAAGGQDGEALESARANAPLQTRTLGRAVSIEDYADFARGFAGIAKARADWIAVGPGRGVLLTVAGDAGAAVDPAGNLGGRLLTALRDYGDPWLPLRLASYRPRPFRLAAGLRLAPEADAPVLIADLGVRLAAAFAFEARDFGAGVSVDEIAALLHGWSPLLVSVQLTALHTGAVAEVRPRLFAELPVAHLAALPQGAELLLLDGEPDLDALS